jgi:hypothetical protein
VFDASTSDGVRATSAPRRAPIEPIEEAPAVVGEVLPAVLAIENHAHDRRPGAVGPVLAPDLAQALEEVRDRLIGIPALVDESDAVRELVIAEEHRDLPRRRLDPPGAVERRPCA